MESLTFLPANALSSLRKLVVSFWCCGCQQVTGDVKIYVVGPEWILMAGISVCKDMEACIGTLMVPGYGQAYILQGNGMLDVDLYDLLLILTPTAVVLEFVPACGTTAGVPKGFECTAPRIPTEATANTSTLFAQIPLGRLDLASKPSAMSLLLFSLQCNITNSLEVGLNRVYIAEHHRDNKTHLFVKLLIGEQGPDDSNQEHAEELIEHLVTSPTRSRLACIYLCSRILVLLLKKFPRLWRVVTMVGQLVPLQVEMFLVALAAGFAAVAVLFRMHAQNACFQLQRVQT